MIAFYFAPGFDAPLPFYVSEDDEQQVLTQLDNTDKGRRLAGSTVARQGHALYEVRGTEWDAQPNPAAEAELHRLTGKPASVTGPLVVLYAGRTQPRLSKKAYFRFSDSASLPYFKVWAALIAASLAAAAPYRGARHYWDYLLDGEIEVEPESEPDSFIVLAGSPDSFKRVFCEVAQPAIDRVFDTGLRADDAPEPQDDEDDEDE